MKKISLLLLLLIPLIASAYTGEAEIDGIYYNIVTKGKDAEVIGCKNEITNLKIPETVEYEGVTCNVTAIHHRAFLGKRNLTTVTLPNSIVKVDHFAFSGCTNLTSIAIPQSVTYLGQGVFYECENLSTVEISSITQWLNIINYKETFPYPYSLQIDGVPVKELNFQNDVTDIKDGTFQNCISIEKVVFAGEVKNIGDSAFKGCKNIKEIKMSENVISIGPYSFEGCEKLESLDISRNIGTIETSAFKNCINLRELRIPEGVKQIKGYSFDGCTNLEKVYLPSSVNTILEFAFRRCLELTDFFVYGTSTKAHSYSFNNSDVKYVTLHVPASSLEYYKSTYPWSDFGNIVALTEDDETGIIAATEEPTEQKQFFTLDGKRICNPQKGINIVRMPNGRTKKEMIK